MKKNGIMVAENANAHHEGNTKSERVRQMTVEIGEGMKFRGHAKKKIPKGHGILTHNGGVLYKGSFKNGNIHGFGIYLNPDGGTYEGNFVDGLYHGYGKLTLPDGIVQSGQFNMGQRHGMFIQWNPKTK